jgi:hypothetical protein
MKDGKNGRRHYGDLLEHAMNMLLGRCDLAPVICVGDIDSGCDLVKREVGHRDRKDAGIHFAKQPKKGRHTPFAHLESMKERLIDSRGVFDVTATVTPPVREARPDPCRDNEPQEQAASGGVHTGLAPKLRQWSSDTEATRALSPHHRIVDPGYPRHVDARLRNAQLDANRAPVNGRRPT